MNRSFVTEKEMAEVFLLNSQLNIDSKYSEWNKWQEVELGGFFGIPDVIMAFGKLNTSGKKIIRTHAFELKLKNWKRALMQAYRYSAFSHYSYVVLDYAHAQSALTHIDMFQRSNIGLATLDITGKIIVHNMPKFQKPYSEQLYKNLSVSLIPKLFA